KRSVPVQILSNRIKHSNSNQIRLSFAQSEEVVSGFGRHVANIVDEGLLQNFFGWVVQALRKSLKNRQIRRTFQVEDPPHLLGLVVLLEANSAQGFKHLVAPVVDTMGLSNKGDDYISVGSLVQKH